MIVDVPNSGVALAVSGARAEQDEACARQAVERLQDRLKQPG